MGIPVLFIRGTKGSGKTKFIEESLMNGDFGDVGKAPRFKTRKRRRGVRRSKVKRQKRLCFKHFKS